MEIETLRCSTCKKYLPISEFRKNKARSSGFSSDCRSCEKIRDNSIESKYRSYRRNAKQRNIEFKISKEDFFELVKMECKYCGSKGNPYNGVDRVDNSKGYIISNCVPCCEWCNKTKMAHTESELIDHIEKMYKNMIISRQKGE